MTVSDTIRIGMLVMAMTIIAASIIIAMILGPTPDAFGIILVGCAVVIAGTFVDWLHCQYDRSRRYEIEVQVDSIVKIRFEIWAKDADDLTTKLRDDFQDVFDSYQLAAQFIDMT